MPLSYACFQNRKQSNGPSRSAVKSTRLLILIKNSGTRSHAANQGAMMGSSDLCPEPPAVKLNCHMEKTGGWWEQASCEACDC